MKARMLIGTVFILLLESAVGSSQTVSLNRAHPLISAQTATSVARPESMSESESTTSRASGKKNLKQQTGSLQVTFNDHQPGLSALSVDSLKRGGFRPSPIVDAGTASVQYVTSEKNGWVRYALASDPTHIVWEMRCNGDTLTMRSLYQVNGASQDLTWKFDSLLTRATLLGHVTASGDIALPAVLHLPGMGSLRIYAKGNDSSALHYVALRRPTSFVTVTFPAATAQNKMVEYTLETAAIYPAIPGMEADDRRFDGYRRDFLDIFQLHAELHVLANNSASDPCAFTVYEYADMARYTPELVKGLTALDLIRETLDHYLAGFLAYGMPGNMWYDHQTPPGAIDFQERYTFSDTYPSLLISAYDYVDGSGDKKWLRKNYKQLRRWADTLTVENADNSPLLEYPMSGNSGSWTKKWTVRPANWWDDIGFGHQDAYSNALGYRALRSMAALADRMGEISDAARYRKRADAIRTVYFSTFFDSTAGVLAGWKSRDGELHNYFFPYVNGIASRYGLLNDKQAHQVMDNILHKMDSVGYNNFALGLPGNLIPIKRADYPEPDPRYGSPTKEDGSDTFENYENGGATASFAYFTMAALYQSGETEEGDKILMPMLDSFAKQGFSGFAPNGQSYDWKDWQGGAHGYEGFLVDNYYALLSVLDRAHMIVKIP